MLSTDSAAVPIGAPAAVPDTLTVLASTGWIGATVFAGALIVTVVALALDIRVSLTPNNDTKDDLYEDTTREPSGTASPDEPVDALTVAFGTVPGITTHTVRPFLATAGPDSAALLQTRARKAWQSALVWAVGGLSWSVVVLFISAPASIPYGAGCLAAICVIVAVAAAGLRLRGMRSAHGIKLRTISLVAAITAVTLCLVLLLVSALQGDTSSTAAQQMSGVQA
ncbi:hypothetical protein ACI2IX_20050 [Leifsonia aquatica]|uniref:hypothetical protein n=1 Tax=Leifsonia aquatica TaxID=144185 RepID=UPI00384E419F